MSHVPQAADAAAKYLSFEKTKSLYSTHAPDAAHARPSSTHPNCIDGKTFIQDIYFACTYIQTDSWELVDTQAL